MKHVFQVKKMIMAAVCLALCMVLPFLTGQIPEIGSKLSPMHIPVLLCGFVCGWPWGLLVGLIAPPLRFMLFGMPPIFPTGAAMMAELAVYGAAAGIFYRLLPKNIWTLYAALLIAMLLGRLAWGGMQWIFLIAGAVEFSFRDFVAGAFVNALPGIICHVLIIPPIVLALQKERVIR